MRKFGFVFMIFVLLAGGMAVAVPATSFAQDNDYPPPPADPLSAPWVGTDTPWVYYNGDWFLNGVLYYFFGPEYGWAPYYAYPRGYIVRPGDWYAPRWRAWYHGHPHYWVTFKRSYPYWHNHHHGRVYSRTFYNRHHHGHGGGWQQGYHGRPAPPHDVHRRGHAKGTRGDIHQRPVTKKQRPAEARQERVHKQQPQHRGQEGPRHQKQQAPHQQQQHKQQQHKQQQRQQHPQP